MFDESDYYLAQREDEYDPEAAPYEPLAPDLAGKSPLKSWRNTEAKPTGSQDSGMNLREGSVLGASPTPEQKDVKSGPEAYTIPSYFGAENAKQIVDIVGAPTAQESYVGRTLRSMQQYAAGVRGYMAEKVGDLFARRNK